MMQVGASLSMPHGAPRGTFSMRGFVMTAKDVCYPEGSDVQWDRWRREVGYALRQYAETQAEKDTCKDFMDGKRLSPNGLRVLYRLEARASRPVLNTWKEGS